MAFETELVLNCAQKGVKEKGQKMSYVLMMSKLSVAKCRERHMQKSADSTFLRASYATKKILGGGNNG